MYMLKWIVLSLINISSFSYILHFYVTFTVIH